MSPLDLVATTAKTLFPSIVLCCALATAGQASPLLLDFDVDPKGDEITDDFLNTPLNDAFDYVGVEFSWDINENGGTHFCYGSTPTERGAGEGDSVYAIPPRSTWDDPNQNVISPCEEAPHVSVTFPDFSANVGDLHVIFDRPVVNLCVDYIFASSSPQTGLSKLPYFAEVVGGGTPSPNDRIRPEEGPVDGRGVLCIDGEDPLVTGNDFDHVLVSTQNTRMFLDNFVVTYDPRLIDFDLDPDGFAVDGSLPGIDAINETYEQKGVRFYVWDDQSDCGDSSSIPNVYARDERAGDSAGVDVGSAANSVSMNGSGDVSMNSSDPWIEAEFFLSNKRDEICIDVSRDATSSGEGILRAYDRDGAVLDTDVSSMGSSGQIEDETLCVSTADPEIACVRFAGQNGGEVYFDNLLLVPEPACPLLAASAILGIAALRRLRRSH